MHDSLYRCNHCGVALSGTVNPCPDTEACAVRYYLEQVYTLRDDERDRGVDLVFQHCDRLMSAGKFEELDRILQELDVTRLITQLLRSFLTITYYAKDRLPSREEFLQRSEAEMSLRIGPERAAHVLRHVR